MEDKGRSLDHSTPEGTVEGHLKAAVQLNFKKRCRYIDPRVMTESHAYAEAVENRMMRDSGIKFMLTDVKTTLVSKKENVVWKGDKWYRVKNEKATVEVSFKLNGKKFQYTEKLLLLDNKWYIEEVELDLITHYMNETRRRRLRR